MTPKSWWWIIGGGVFGTAFIRFVINKVLERPQIESDGADD